MNQGINTMAIRVITTHLLLLLLLLDISQVSSHSKVNNNGEYQFSQLSHQAFHVFTKGGNRRLMQDIALRFLNYFNPGGSIALAPAPAPAPMECGGLCEHRCRLHSRPKVCKRACGSCCFRCKCVPPGTSGNREMCGKCYTDMTTHGNRTKCP